MTRLLTVALGVACLVSGCDDSFALATPDDPRFLDRACEVNLCETSGVAKVSSGITGDSIGFRLGSGPGSVRIPLKNIAMVSSQGQLSLLMSGSGQVQVSVESESNVLVSEQFELQDNYGWRTLKLNNNTADSSTYELLIQTQGGSKADLIDLRAEGFAETFGCSMSGLGHGDLRGIILIGLLVLATWCQRLLASRLAHR